MNKTTLNTRPSCGTPTVKHFTCCGISSNATFFFTQIPVCYKKKRVHLCLRRYVNCRFPVRQSFGPGFSVRDKSWSLKGERNLVLGQLASQRERFSIFEVRPTGNQSVPEIVARSPSSSARRFRMWRSVVEVGILDNGRSASLKKWLTVLSQAPDDYENPRLGDEKNGRQTSTQLVSIPTTGFSGFCSLISDFRLHLTCYLRHAGCPILISHSYTKNPNVTTVSTQVFKMSVRTI